MLIKIGIICFLLELAFSCMTWWWDNESSNMINLMESQKWWSGTLVTYIQANRWTKVLEGAIAGDDFLLLYALAKEIGADCGSRLAHRERWLVIGLKSRLCVTSASVEEGAHWIASRAGTRTSVAFSIDRGQTQRIDSWLGSVTSSSQLTICTDHLKGRDCGVLDLLK